MMLHCRTVTFVVQVKRANFAVDSLALIQGIPALQGSGLFPNMSSGPDSSDHVRFSVYVLDEPTISTSLVKVASSAE